MFIDTSLSISAVPAGWYAIEVYLQFTTGGSVVNGFSGDIVKLDNDVFAFGSSGSWEYVKSTSTAAESYTAINNLGVLVYPSSGAGKNALKFMGMVNNIDGDGIAITWGQGTLTPGNATTLESGYIKATKLLDL